MNRNLSNILDRLKGVAKTRPNQWTALCPAHDDKKPSLSITAGDDERVLLYCFAGCSAAKVVKAIGMGMKDLFLRNGGGKDQECSFSTKGANGSSRKAFATETNLLEWLRDRVEGKYFATWVYNYIDGIEAFRVVRFNLRNGNKEIRPYHRTSTGWFIGDPPGKLPLYNLGKIAEAERVYVFEGEKCVDIASHFGLTATTSAHGAGSFQKADWSPLMGREVVLVPDAGRTGRAYATGVAQLLLGLDPSMVVKVLDLPGLADQEDIEQFVERLRDEGVSVDDVRMRIEAMSDRARRVTAKGANAVDDATRGQADRSARKSPQSDTSEESESQVKQLVGVLTGQGDPPMDVDLFRDGRGDAYATIPIDFLPEEETEHRDKQVRETCRITSSRFRDWATAVYFELFEKPKQGVLEFAINAVKANVMLGKAQREVHIRTAGDTLCYFIDLGTPDWHAVRIVEGEWKIIPDPPVKFRRERGMLPLPVPSPGGSLEELRSFVNVSSEDDWRLLVAWVTAALRPIGPYPILNLTSEHGSGKSTQARLIRSFVDPNAAPLRAQPKEGRDFVITANNSWMIALDNLSGLSPWLSDALCRMSTGGGFATRKLYTDSDEVIFDAKRPVLLNGIGDSATRGDLADRCVTLHLPSIPPEKRRTEQELFEQLSLATPRVFGALLDVLAGAKQELETVKLASMPRMADFARWGVAVERAIGWPAGSFLAAYNANRAEVNQTAVESSPVVTAICDCVAHRSDGQWSGTCKEVLRLINDGADERTRAVEFWPKSARGLRAALGRYAPNLRGLGWHIAFSSEQGRGRGSRGRTVSLRAPLKVDDVVDDPPHRAADRPQDRQSHESQGTGQLPGPTASVDDVDGLGASIGAYSPEHVEQAHELQGVKKTVDDVDDLDGSSTTSGCRENSDTTSNGQQAERIMGEDRPHRPPEPTSSLGAAEDYVEV